MKAALDQGDALDNLLPAHDIFISHKSDDRITAECLASSSVLRTARNDTSTRLTRRCQAIPHNWRSTYFNAIHNCKALLAFGLFSRICSRPALGLRWCAGPFLWKLDLSRCYLVAKIPVLSAFKGIRFTISGSKRTAQRRASPPSSRDSSTKSNDDFVQPGDARPSAQIQRQSSGDSGESFRSGAGNCYVVTLSDRAGSGRPW